MKTNKKVKKSLFGFGRGTDIVISGLLLYFSVGVGLLYKSWPSEELKRQRNALIKNIDINSDGIYDEKEMSVYYNYMNSLGYERVPRGAIRNKLPIMDLEDVIKLNELYEERKNM